MGSGQGRQGESSQLYFRSRAAALSAVFRPGCIFAQGSHPAVFMEDSVVKALTRFIASVTYCRADRRRHSGKKQIYIPANMIYGCRATLKCNCFCRQDLSAETATEGSALPPPPHMGNMQKASCATCRRTGGSSPRRRLTTHLIPCRFQCLLTHRRRVAVVWPAPQAAAVPVPSTASPGCALAVISGVLSRR